MGGQVDKPTSAVSQHQSIRGFNLPEANLSVSCLFVPGQIEPFLGPSKDVKAATAAAAALAADIRARGMKAAVALAVRTGVDAVMALLESGAVDMVRCNTLRALLPGGIVAALHMTLAMPMLHMACP